MLSQFKQPRRVVITGLGCVTPIGIGREAFWSALTRGESGVRRIESYDVSESAVKIAAEVHDFDWEAQLNPKDRKHVPRTVPLALAAAREAIEDSGLAPNEFSLEERRAMGVVIGTGGGGLPSRNDSIPIGTWAPPFKGERVHNSRSYTRRLVQRVVDGFWTARAFTHRLDWMHEFDGCDRILRSTHSAWAAGHDVSRWCGCAYSRRESWPDSI